MLPIWVQVGRNSINPKSVDLTAIIEVEEKIAAPYTRGGITTHAFFYKTTAGLSWCTYNTPTGAKDGLQDLHDELRRMNGNKC